MDEIIEATPEGLLEEVKDVVDAVVSLPDLSIEVNVLNEKIASFQNTIFWIGLIELLLVIAVIFLLVKHYKK